MFVKFAKALAPLKSRLPSFALCRFPMQRIRNLSEQLGMSSEPTSAPTPEIVYSASLPSSLLLPTRWSVAQQQRVAAARLQHRALREP